MGWKKDWTWVSLLTEERRLSVTSKKEGDLFGRDTMTAMTLGELPDGELQSRLFLYLL